MLDKAADVFSIDGLQPIWAEALQVQQKTEDGAGMRAQRVGSAVTTVKFSQVCLAGSRPHRPRSVIFCSALSIIFCLPRRSWLSSETACEAVQDRETGKRRVGAMAGKTVRASWPSTETGSGFISACLRVFVKKKQMMNSNQTSVNHHFITYRSDLYLYSSNAVAIKVFVSGVFGMNISQHTGVKLRNPEGDRKATVRDCQLQRLVQVSSSQLCGMRLFYLVVLFQLGIAIP